MNSQTPNTSASCSEDPDAAALPFPGRRAVFLDRDGTIMEDTGYPRHPDEVRLLPGVCQALGDLQRRGYAIVLVSNQSGVGRGMISLEQAQKVHHRLEEQLAAGGVRLDGFFYCYDSPVAATEFRKPGIGMLLDARRELSLRFEGSFMIGDKSSDVEAGKNAGCRTIFFAAASGATHPPNPNADFIASTWDEVLQIVLECESK